jgi:hypothetical protein
LLVDRCNAHPLPYSIESDTFPIGTNKQNTCVILHPEYRDGHTHTQDSKDSWNQKPTDAYKKTQSTKESLPLDFGGSFDVLSNQLFNLAKFKEKVLLHSFLDGYHTNFALLLLIIAS